MVFTLRDDVLVLTLTYLTTIQLFDLFHFSCNSFEYGHGYNSKGVFQDDLFFKKLGQCKLRSENTGLHELKSCAYSYYEKTTSTGSTVADVPLALLLSLSVVTSATI